MIIWPHGKIKPSKKPGVTVREVWCEIEMGEVDSDEAAQVASQPV